MPDSQQFRTRFVYRGIHQEKVEAVCWHQSTATFRQRLVERKWKIEGLLYTATASDRGNKKMKTVEVKISDIIIRHPDIDTFAGLLETVRGITSDAMLFLEFDIKPDYRDTPRDWQWQLEGAFTGGKR